MLVFQIIYKNWNLVDVFVDLVRCHGSWYDVTSTIVALNILLCNLPSFHKHWSDKKPFRASLSEDLRFVVRAGLIAHVTGGDLLQPVAATCHNNLSHCVSRPLSEGLRFVVWAGLIYKTKTPLISRQLTTNKAFKRGSSFCSLSRLNLQNEGPIDFASVDNEQSI